MDDLYIVEKELSYEIMGVAFDVHNALGPGFTENIYDEAMAREFARRNIPIERQKRILVKFKGDVVGEYFLDCVVRDRVILEYKAVTEIARVHELQALSYLKATNLELAIVLNFGAERVQDSRVAYTKGKAKLPSRLPELHTKARPR